MQIARDFTTSKIKEGSVWLTPADADFIVNQLRYDHQRDETRAKGHIAILREQMKRGVWLPKSQIDFARLQDGKIILVNGHHRMRAQAESGTEILWNIAIHDCANMDAVRGLYHRFDTNLRLRSAENILAGAGFSEETGLPPIVARAVYRATPVIATGMRMLNGMGDEKALAVNMIDDRLDLARQYAEVASELADILAPAPTPLKRKLMTGSVFAVVLVTASHRPQQAREFWGGIALNDGLRRYDPRATLIQYLMAINGKNALAGAGMYAAARAWTAFAEDEELKYIKVAQGYRVRIAGTPYTVTV